MNKIWLSMMLIAVVTGVFTGHLSDVVLSVTESAKFAFSLAFGLTGVMSLWLGVMKIAEAAGLLALLSRALKPLLVRLFPDVPADHPAMGSMTANITANMFGLNNAATPFGLRAMQELAELNNRSGVATNAMCTFITLHSSNLQVVPVTAIALLAAAGAIHPTDIIVPFLLSSFCAVITAIVISKIMERKSRYRYAEIKNEENSV